MAFQEIAHFQVDLGLAVSVASSLTEGCVQEDSYHCDSDSTAAAAAAAAVVVVVVVVVSVVIEVVVVASADSCFLPVGVVGAVPVVALPVTGTPRKEIKPRMVLWVGHHYCYWCCCCQCYCCYHRHYCSRCFRWRMNRRPC